MQKRTFPDLPLPTPRRTRSRTCRRWRSKLAGDERMLLDALMKTQGAGPDDFLPPLVPAKGVCGSDAMNINGKERGWACLTNMRTPARRDHAQAAAGPARRART